jgi:hypothetical protein
MVRGGEKDRAAVLARKDAPRKRIQDNPEIETSSESDADAAAQVEELRKKERELKRIREDNESLERQMAEENAKKKAKLAELASLRNSYPVI